MSSEHVIKEREYWWEANLHSRQLVTSAHMMAMCGLSSRQHTLTDLQLLVETDYKTHVQKGLEALFRTGTFSPIEFEILTRFGYRWVRAVVSGEYLDATNEPIAYGYFEFLNVNEVNAYINAHKEDHRGVIAGRETSSIPESLLNLMYVSDRSKVISQTLGNLLREFNGDRAYMFEYDLAQQTQCCTYEVTRDQAWAEQPTLQNIPLSATQWWTQRLLYDVEPIVYSDIADLPPEAASEYEILKRQGIKSVLVVPLITKNGVGGYLGIDMVEQCYEWSEADIRWFQMLGNIISLTTELKKSEEQAVIERENFYKLYHTMPIGFVKIDLLFDSNGNPIDFIFKEANLVACNLFSACGVNEVLGCKISEMYWSASSEFLLKMRDLIVQGNQMSQSTLRLADFYIDYILYTIDGKSFFVLLQDKTESILANRALRKSEEMLQNIFNNVPIGIEVYDKEGILIDINEIEKDIFGLQRREDALGVSLFDNPNLPPSFLDDMHSGKSAICDFFYDFNKLSGYYDSSCHGMKHIVLKGAVLYDPDKNIENYLMIVLDNTDSLRASHKIQEFEILFNSIAEFSEVGLCQWSPSESKLSGTDQWFANLGITNREISNIFDAYEQVNEEDRQRLVRHFHDITIGKINSFREEIRVNDPEGDKWLSTSFKVSDHSAEDGKSEIIGINIDITQLKNTEIKLLEAKCRAEESDRLKSAFLANMSHEIRTPLNAIVGFSHLLVDTVDMAERQEYIAIIRQNNDLLLQLVSDVLDLSKIESGMVAVTKDKFCVDEVCAEIVASQCGRLSESVELSFDTKNSSCHLLSDRNRITQVLNNLVTNAIKFTARGTIVIGYDVMPGELRFFVRDTGIGIPTEQLEGVFSRFVKLNSFVTGTGLGLSICRGLVQLMGGRIWVESVMGEGSCFYFTIPYEEPKIPEPLKPNESTVAPAPALNAPTQDKPLLLIAEDTDSNYLLISTILKKEYNLIRAVNGLEAIELYQQHNPNLILMDMKMPEMNGLEATRRIKALDPVIPIVMLTAFAFDDDRCQALEAGCIDYLTKPVQVDILKRTIRKYID